MHSSNPLKRFSLVVLAAGLALAAARADARTLENRVGAGLFLHDLNGKAAFSLRYVPRAHWGTGFVAGFDTGSSGFTLLGARVQRHVDLQENLNAYLGLGAYYLSMKSGASTTNGYEVDAVLGVEAFLPGLSDLGIAFETGIGFRSLGGTSLRTLGSGFLGTALHYYF